MRPPRFWASLAATLVDVAIGAAAVALGVIVGGLVLYGIARGMGA